MKHESWSFTISVKWYQVFQPIRSDLRFWFLCKQFMFHVWGFLTAVANWFLPPLANTRIANIEDVKSVRKFFAWCVNKPRRIRHLASAAGRNLHFNAQSILIFFSQNHDIFLMPDMTQCWAAHPAPARIPPCPGSRVLIRSEPESQDPRTKQRDGHYLCVEAVHQSSALAWEIYSPYKRDWFTMVNMNLMMKEYQSSESNWSLVCHYVIVSLVISFKMFCQGENWTKSVYLCY